MMLMRHPVLAAAAVAVTATVSGCGGSAASPQAPVSSPAATSARAASPSASGMPAQPPPAGYRWAGSTSQGVWFAVPASWAAVDLSKISLSQAISRFTPKGVSSSFMRTALTTLSKQHAVFVIDLASAVRSAHHFATNGNALCVATPLVRDAGAPAALKAAVQAEYTQLGAHVLVLKTITVGGNPAVMARYTLTSTAGLTITGTQYSVLAKDSRLCTVTLTTDTPAAYRAIFSKIGSTVHVS